MKKTFLIAEIDVPDVFNDERIRELAATAKIILTCENFDVFKKNVRNAVVNYLRDARRLSDNQLYNERKLLEAAASRHKYKEVTDRIENLSTENRDLLNERCGRVGWRNMYRAIGGARVPSPDMLRDPARRETACDMVASLCREGGRSVEVHRSNGESCYVYRPIIYGPKPRRNSPKRDAERWFIIRLRDACCRAGGNPGWTAHGDPGLTGPFGRMVKKCLSLVVEGKISAVNQINTLNKYRKAQSVRSERQKFAAFLTAVHGEYESSRWRAADLPTKPRLKEVLTEITNKEGKINVRVLGRWLAKHSNGWSDGLLLVKAGGRAGVTYWRVRKITEGG